MGFVLVVEDDVDLSTLIETIIIGQGHEARVAYDGLEGLERVAERMPDLILLDMNMPVMDGREFAVRFRSLYGRAARIIIMTAAASAARRAQEADADGWLSKPFFSAELNKILATLSAPHELHAGG